MNDREIKANARWSQRFAILARAAAVALPKNDHALALHRDARALHSAVSGGADAMSLVLIESCRATLSGITKVGHETAFKEAVQSDGRAALNRLANMIRRGDPSPTEPREAADASH